ncbi:MAG: GTPase Era [Polyangiaceae bacterium]
MSSGSQSKAARAEREPYTRAGRVKPAAPAPATAPTPLPQGEGAPARSARTRAGLVAIVGRPNVGKSTFLNAALGVDLAIVSKTPQTTRSSLLGIVHKELRSGFLAELRLYDTPGLHDGKTTLNRRMNESARAVLASADAVLFMIAAPKVDPGSHDRGGDLSLDSRDKALLTAIPESAQIVLALNKVDRVRDKRMLLSLIASAAAVRPLAAIVPLSALKNDGVDRLLEEAGALLPEAPHEYGEDDLTDKPMRFFASEYVREQVLLAAREEVPHATAVSVDAFEVGAKITRIAATVHVERLGHKKILVGEGGAMLKHIGTHARLRIEELLGGRVRLELFVRVTEGWRNSPALLDELGYDDLSREATARPRRGAKAAGRAQSKKARS